MIPYKQLSLTDIFQDCQDKFDNDKPAFLSLLEEHIDLDEIIPVSFRNHFYASTGRTRKYPLQAFLWALIIQRIFSIPTDQLLLTFLAYSKPLREFCGFAKVPDASKITRFKQDFLDDLQAVFDTLADLMEPICQAVDSAKADMTVFDSSGIEAFVAERKSGSPDEDKSVHDSKLLISTLKDFFEKHPLIHPKVFPGDAAFDAVPLYEDLLTGDTFGRNRHFSSTYIPLNQRAHLENTDYTINENGIPCCPHDAVLPMKPEGSKSNLHSGLRTFKFVCPQNAVGIR